MTKIVSSTSTAASASWAGSFHTLRRAGHWGSARLGSTGGGPWRAAGCAYPGAYRVARSYEEAREALALAERLRLDRTVVTARELPVFCVVARDQAAVIDLVRAILGPLTHPRGGAEPLLATLDAYFATGGVATETARPYIGLSRPHLVAGVIRDAMSRHR